MREGRRKGQKFTRQIKKDDENESGGPGGKGRAARFAGGTADLWDGISGRTR